MFGQVFMLFKFLYPLYLNLSSNNAKRVLQTMKRSAILSGICFLSDLTAMVIEVLLLLMQHYYQQL